MSLSLMRFANRSESASCKRRFHCEDSSWGRFLYSDSITIGYKVFYWSLHFCPISRADPVFLSFSVSWISEGPVLPSHQPQRVYAWDAEITAYVGYVVSSLGALLLCSRGFLRHNYAAFHLGKRYNVRSKSGGSGNRKGRPGGRPGGRS